MDRVVIRYLRDYKHWRAGTEVDTPIDYAFPLIDAGIVEYVRGEPIPHPDAAETYRQLDEALRAAVLDIVRDAGATTGEGRETAMEKRYSVFISSTFLDLKEEREKVMQAVLRLGYLPLGMEMFPASNNTQREAIRRAIDLADYYVVLVAGRYGTMGPDNLSYTEEEFDYAVSQKIPVLAFVHGNPDAIEQGKTDKNDEARKRLEAFRARVSSGRIRNEWTNPDDLASKVTAALVTAVKTHPRPGWVRGSMPGSEGKEPAEPPEREPAQRAPASKVSLRKYLQDGDYRFDELVSGALLRATEAVGTIHADRPASAEEYLVLLQRCEEATADLVEIAAETAYFGKGQQDVLVAAVEQLATVEPRGGVVSLNQLRVYPAVLAFYAAGVAAVHKGNYALLRRFHGLPLVDANHGRAPALRILSPSYALQGPVHPPRENGQTLKSPQSDRILEKIRAPLLELPMMKIKDRYEQILSRFEYLNALAAAVAEGVHPYYGRFRWYPGWYPGAGGSFRSALTEAVDRELTEQGEDWPPFKAGLFGLDPEALRKAKAELDKIAAQFAWQ